MSKGDKKIERDMLVKRTEKNLEGLVNKYESKEQELINLAAQAKKDGRISDYNKTITFLKMYIAKKEKTKSMLHQLRMIKILKDDAEMTNQYLNSMTIISEETSKIYGNVDMKKATKKFRKITRDTMRNQGIFEAFMDEVESSMNFLADDASEIHIDKELEDRINNQISALEESALSDIDKKLADLKNI